MVGTLRIVGTSHRGDGRKPRKKKASTSAVSSTQRRMSSEPLDPSKMSKEQINELISHLRVLIGEKKGLRDNLRPSYREGCSKEIKKLEQQIIDLQNAKRGRVRGGKKSNHRRRRWVA